MRKNTANKVGLVNLYRSKGMTVQAACKKVKLATGTYYAYTKKIPLLEAPPPTRKPPVDLSRLALFLSMAADEMQKIWRKETEGESSFR